MQAIPQCYPVTVEFSDGKPETPILEGVVAELFAVGQSNITESGGVQTQLRVVARSEAMARSRAERATKGVVVEVGAPSALQDYTKRKALPYRRSFVMSRFKRGRFCQQGGTGAATGAALPAADNVASTGVGIPMGESVDALMGPAQLSEGDPFRLARHNLKLQYMKLGFESDAEEQAEFDLFELLEKFRAKHPKLHDAQLAGLLARKTRKDLENIARGESLDEASPAQRAARDRRRRQFRAKHPQTARKLSKAARRSGRKSSVKNRRKKTAHRNRKRTARFRGKTNPHFEGLTEMIPLNPKQLVSVGMFHRRETSFGQAMQSELSDVRKVASRYRAEPVRTPSDFTKQMTWQTFRFDHLNQASRFVKELKALDIAPSGRANRNFFTTKIIGPISEIVPESQQLDSAPAPSVESILSGYPQATVVYEKLRSAPREWLESTRGRKAIIDAIYNVRVKEGNTPADAIESAYLDAPEQLVEV